MSYTDERITHQSSKYGFIKEFIFLALIIAIITYRVIHKLDFISIILLLAVPIVSIIILIKRINKKRLSLAEIFNGIIAGDERIINILDNSGIWAMGFGTGILFAYFVYGMIRFSPESIGWELSLFLLVCLDSAIEGRLIYKNYVACTNDGFEEPYYEDKVKKKEIMKRIFKSWLKYALIFSLVDVIAGMNILKQSIGDFVYKYIFVLSGEMIICLIFAIIDILIMGYINKKIYNQTK